LAWKPQRVLALLQRLHCKGANVCTSSLASSKEEREKRFKAKDFEQKSKAMQFTFPPPLFPCTIPRALLLNLLPDTRAVCTFLKKNNFLESQNVRGLRKLRKESDTKTPIRAGCLYPREQAPTLC
jgi:hypothetical protein